MDRDDIGLLLIARTPEHIGIGSAYFYVRDAVRCTPSSCATAPTCRGEPVSQPWGLREFRVLDPDRNRLTFAQTFE
jgi:hypothetical protein